MRISSKDVVYTMSSDNKGVARCNPGDKVVFETRDCFSNQLKSEKDLLVSIDFDKVNPATGPLEINGAKPGDVLKVEIKEIKIAEQGVMITVPEMGIVFLSL